MFGYSVGYQSNIAKRCPYNSGEKPVLQHPPYNEMQKYMRQNSVIKPLYLAFMMSDKLLSRG